MMVLNVTGAGVKCYLRFLLEGVQPNESRKRDEYRKRKEIIDSPNVQQNKGSREAPSKRQTMAPYHVRSGPCTS